MRFLEGLAEVFSLSLHLLVLALLTKLFQIFDELVDLVGELVLLIWLPKLVDFIGFDV